MLTIVTLGTGNEMFLTRGVEKALYAAQHVVLRTERHPMVDFLRVEGIAFESLDALYDACEDFDAFNRAAAVKLLSLAKEANVCYAVSDASFDTTVSTIQRLKPRDAQVVLLPGVSHAERCLSLIENHRDAMRLYTAESFLLSRVSPEEDLLLVELHSRECAGECKLKLMELMPEEEEITFITGNEKTGELKRSTIPLFELDRQKHYDHLTAVFIPGVEMLKRERFDMDDLMHVVRRLRAPDGCPWDREQTHETLLTDLLEESYEFIQAVRDEDIDHMYDELGDVLLQVALHTEIARQCGEFNLNDVTSAIAGKMIERHTHVFGQVKADTSEDVLNNWEALKREQRGIQTHADAMDNVSTGLSPLMRAAKVQKKARKVGFDWDSAQEALYKVHEEADEVLDNLKKGVDPAEELGDLFFAAVNVCRLCKKDPDLALHFATNKFIHRFRKMENAIKTAGKSLEDLTLSEMDVYWNAGKRDE
ncbi:MAG: nucleoside triphosphate pyrophosphohydrolase [Clostridia bacterium]|nr:nucleoside triphosphate pyrophosphohydrolase [Clostridia bacterium]